MTAIDAPNCRWCRLKLPRGSYVHVFRRNYYAYSECRSKSGCMDRVVKQRNALMRIGGQMYNCFYNMAQRTEQIHPEDNRVFREMRDGWQSAKTQTGL